ncbi:MULTISPECIES: [FeFe] hydrogenase, group A [Terrabacteria group]|uniref:[FeFe] hydrogenase, group A n=1 Tax=Bacillati TaxID=1783272 RepID=UPI001C6DE05B|nr:MULTISPECIES: [FeFe] hydrogenase, group A [Terrabacteria group]MBW9212708.1 [FeFe] hydrogenase, group A [Trueperella sp. zg.1013]
MSQYQNLDKRVPIALDNISLVQDLDKCKNCTLCRRACANDAGVMDYYDLTTNGDKPICINCGQCAVACPFDCINERSELAEVKNAIADPKKVVVFQTAPAVRVGVGEEFGMEYGSFVEGKVVTALRRLGADYVLDTNFGADMTIMEEASELIDRLTGGDKALPQFTSCCPAWVKFAETFYPELIPHLSSAKSPILMEAAAQKTYFAEKHQINPSQMVTVCVTPCTAKKAEIRRPEMNGSAHYWNIDPLRDGDLCITVRELAKWIREEEMDFVNLEEGKFDHLMGEASGGGIIFGNTGGVMEAAMRSAYKFMTNENAPLTLIPFEEIRGLKGVKEADVQIGDCTLHVAAISGTGNFRKFYLEMKESGKHYDFIEVMACPGGCIGGGGMPRVKMPKVMAAKQARIDSLYKRDGEVVIKAAQDNPEIQKIYDEFFTAPMSEKAHHLLHTESYVDRSSDLGPNGACTPETCPTSVANLKKQALEAKK